MQTFKKIISKLTKESIFTQIIDSKSAKQQQFSQAIQQFSHYDAEKKLQIFDEIFGTFKRQRSSRSILLALLLIDYLSSLQPQITLFHNTSQPKLTKNNMKKHLLINEKIFTAEEQFIKFYYTFLKQSTKKTEKQIDFNCCQLDDWIEYCNISVNQILELIKIDFILNFLAKNSPHFNIIRMGLESIFQKISFDLKIINRFLEKHLRLVTQKHSQAFRINQIYEKLLFVNTNLPKFSSILKKLTKRITFESYEVDKQLNKSIQLEMYQRQDQKRHYIISSRKKIQQNHKTEQTDNKQVLIVEGQTMIRLTDFI